MSAAPPGARRRSSRSDAGIVADRSSAAAAADTDEPSGVGVTHRTDAATQAHATHAGATQPEGPMEPDAPAGKVAVPLRDTPRPDRIAVRVALAPIRVYQRLISPALPRRCKYHPTCSAYAVQAVQSYGILRGAMLAAWRLLRCNPFSHGGYDPVTAQTLFRRPPRKHSSSASHS